MRLNKSFVLLLLLIFPLFAFAQENSNATKAQKKAEKQEIKRKEKARKADLKGKQRHYKIQDRKTRKRMKKHRRQVNSIYIGERPGFFKRLFRKKGPISFYYFDHPLAETNYL